MVLKIVKDLNPIGAMDLFTKPECYLCMDKHLMIIKYLHNRKFTLINKYLQIYGACWNKTTFRRFLVSLISISNWNPWSQIILIVGWRSYSPDQMLRGLQDPSFWYLVVTYPHPHQFTIFLSFSASTLCSSVSASVYPSFSLLHAISMWTPHQLPPKIDPFLS